MSQKSGLMRSKRGVIVVGPVARRHVDSGYHVAGIKRPEAPDILLSHSAAKE
jgi:hypothetical protein